MAKKEKVLKAELDEEAAEKLEVKTMVDKHGFKWELDADGQKVKRI
tara:strand:- start:566 stop:703 length:138 start_codon:yes stop_codon:yes gene_type:complete